MSKAGWHGRVEFTGGLEALSLEDYQVDLLANLAYEIATKLWQSDLTGPGGCMVLGMAMGLYLESVEGSHREMLPLAEAVLQVAREVFDQFRSSRDRGEFGNA